MQRELPKRAARRFTRRSVLRGLAVTAVAGAGLAGYAFGVEPMWRLAVSHYHIRPPRWPAGLELKLAVLADLHAGEPYMSAARIAGLVERTNALGADAILLLGDYVTHHKLQTRIVPPREWSQALSGLRAPLGVHAVLGNHDWWDDAEAQRRGAGPIYARRELERVGFPVYENSAVRLVKGGRPFWLAGLADQLALIVRRRGSAAAEPQRQANDTEGLSPFARALAGRRRYAGLDDLDGTLGQVTDDAPVILLAHEPDIFPRVPDRVALTISGHTHGGQVRLFGWSPIVPSRYGNRYAYGHIVEGGRNMIVSGGLGCSILPVRFGMPPEIVVVTLS